MSYTRYQFRRGTAAEWIAAQDASTIPILIEGEMGYVTDLKRAKIGDGTQKWNDLPYIDSSSNVVASSATLDLSGSDSGSILVKNADGVAKYSDVLRIRDSKETDLSGSVRIKGAVLPTVPNTFSLGATGARWSSIYMGASGDIHLGYTTMSDSSGKLKVSGSIIPGSNAATIGTANEPWNRMFLGKNMVDTSGINTAIVPLDVYAIDDEAYGTTNTTFSDISDIIDIATSADGKVIVAISYTQIFRCTDGIGAQFSSIYTTDVGTTLRKCSVSGNGSNIYIARVNSGTTQIVRITNNNATVQTLSVSSSNPKFLETDVDGKTVVLYVDDADEKGRIFISKDFGGNFTNSSTGLNADETPTVEDGRLFDLWLSQDGNRIYITQKIIDDANKVLTKNIKTKLLTYSSSNPSSNPTWAIQTDISSGIAFPMRVAGCNDDSIYAYAYGFASNGYSQATSSITVRKGPLLAEGVLDNKERLFITIGNPLAWTKLRFSNDGKYLVGIAGNSIYSFVLEYGTTSISVKKSNSITITNPSISAISHIALSGDGTRRLALYNTGAVGIGIDDYTNTNGRIGIGTITPSARLEIANPVVDGESTALLLRNTASTSTGQSVSVAFSASTNTNGARINVDTTGTMTIDTSGSIVSRNSSITVPHMKTYANYSKFGSSGSFLSINDDMYFTVVRNSIIAIISPQKLYISSDNGKSFDTKLTSPTFSFKSVNIDANNNIYVFSTAGINRAIIGTTWSLSAPMSSTRIANLQAISPSGQNLVLLNTDGFIHTSPNFNATSSIVYYTIYTIDTSIAQSVKGICVADDGAYWYCSYGNKIYSSIMTSTTNPPIATSYDVLASWSTMSGSATCLYMIAVATNSNGTSSVYRTTNRGVSWNKITDLTGSLTLSAVSSDGQCMVLAEKSDTVAGKLYISNTYGEVWNLTTYSRKWRGVSISDGSIIVGITNNDGVFISNTPSESVAGSSTGIGTKNPLSPLDIRSYDSGHPTVISVQSDVNSYGSGNEGPSIDFYTRNRGDGSRNLQATIQGIDTKTSDPTHGGIRVLTNRGGVQTEVMRLHQSENVLYGETAWADLSTPGNILKAGLNIRTISGSQVLKLGAYYTGGAGSGSAIQAADQFAVGGVLKDNPNTLTLNPLGGTVAIKGPVNITRNMDAAGGGLVVQHTNESQGIGIGFNTIYASGTATNQNININAKGTGTVNINNLSISNISISAPTTKTIPPTPIANSTYTGTLRPLFWDTATNQLAIPSEPLIRYFTMSTPKSTGSSVDVKDTAGNTFPSDKWVCAVAGFYNSSGDRTYNCSLTPYANSIWKIQYDHAADGAGYVSILAISTQLMASITA